MTPRRPAPWLLAVLSATLASGCASPGPQIEVIDVSRAQQGPPIRTVDVMPLALGVDVHPGRDLDRTRHAVEPALLREVLSELAVRHYRVAAIIDRAGRYSRGRVRQAMTPAALQAATLAVADHAAERRSDPAGPGHVALPPLGRETGSDATLFVGGHAYLGRPVGADDFLDVLTALTAASTVVGAAAALGAEGSAAERTNRALEVLNEGTAVMEELEASKAELPPRPPGPPSHLRVTMTLVDNRTGQVLWHADRALLVSPTEPVWIRKAVRVATRRLPCGGSPPRREPRRALREERAPPCRR